MASTLTINVCGNSLINGQFIDHESSNSDGGQFLDYECDSSLIEANTWTKSVVTYKGNVVTDEG